jgi:hypothetical protein
MNRRFSALAAPRLTVNPDHKPWTDEDDDRLAAMFRNNDTDAVMAEALGRTKKAIGLRRIWLGLNRRVQGTGKVMDPEQRAAAVVLASEVGASKAAEAVGVTDRTIVRWRNGHTQKVAPTDAPGRVVPNEWTKRSQQRWAAPRSL